jgi:hypothetical protein
MWVSEVAGCFSSSAFPTRLCHPLNSVIPSEVEGPTFCRHPATATLRQIRCAIGHPTSRGPQDAGVGSQPHPQPAVILRKRRPSQREGLPTKDLCTLQVPIRIPAVVIPSKARDLQSSVSENPGAPHLAVFEMWVSESAAHPSQPAVILRKRRPSQREGLPTKDLYTPRPRQNSSVVIPSKARDLQPSALQ